MLPTTLVAEDGYDPSTSGLWAQHAPAAPIAAGDLDICRGTRTSGKGRPPS